MKTSVLLFAFLSILYNQVDGQDRIDSKRYDHRNYDYQEGDPYNIDKVRVASLIPGLGQMVAGEGLRGALFMGSWIASWAMLIGGVKMFFHWDNLCSWEGGSMYGSEYCATTHLAEIGFASFCTGLVGIPLVRIWSMIDAPRVAKVNNLAWRDMQISGSNINIFPFLATSRVTSNRLQAGVTLMLSF